MDFFSSKENRTTIKETITIENHEKHPNTSYIAIHQLIVRDLNKASDLGSYKCVVVDNLKHERSAKFKLNMILGKCTIK